MIELVACSERMSHIQRNGRTVGYCSEKPRKMYSLIEHDLTEIEINEATQAVAAKWQVDAETIAKPILPIDPARVPAEYWPQLEEEEGEDDE